MTAMTVTPIFDELAERLGLTWDMDAEAATGTDESPEVTEPLSA